MGKTTSFDARDLSDRAVELRDDGDDSGFGGQHGRVAPPRATILREAISQTGEHVRGHAALVQTIEHHSQPSHHRRQQPEATV